MPVGYKGFSVSSELSGYQPNICSERNLAFAILKQAWREAVIDLCVVRENSRDDCIHLKRQAIQWICSDEHGFLYWCQLADVNHAKVRQKLSEALRSQNHTV